MAQVAHDLHSLFVLGSLFGVAAVDHGPVGGADQRHLAELGHLFQGFQGAGGPGAAGTGHDGRRLVAQGASGAVGQTVHKAQHPRGGGGIVHRRAENKGVGLLSQGHHIGHRTAENALAGFGAAAAAHAAAHRSRSDVEDGGLDAVGVQRLGHFLQGRVSAAVGMGTAVDEQNIHCKIPPYMAPAL